MQKARYEFHESKKEFGVDGAIDELKKKWDEEEKEDKVEMEGNEGDIGEVLMDNYYDDSKESFQ